MIPIALLRLPESLASASLRAGPPARCAWRPFAHSTLQSPSPIPNPDSQMHTLVSSILKTGVQLALGFVREHTRESCTRLCAVICCVTGCSAAIATVCFAFINPLRAATVAALVGVTSALIAAGCVALLTRTRSTEVHVPSEIHHMDGGETC